MSRIRGIQREQDPGSETTQDETTRRGRCGERNADEKAKRTRKKRSKTGL
jgi:hypothetical protein